MPSDDVPRRMLVLLLELLTSDELPELAVAGAWCCINEIMIRGSAALGSMALESDICGLAVAHLQAIGSATDWVVSTWHLHALCLCLRLRLPARMRADACAVAARR